MRKSTGITAATPVPFILPVEGMQLKKREGTGKMETDP
jgi:hypothetical protein